MSGVIALANAQQIQASDPGVSAFVAASAGAGKTKLLTDRLLRLMLGGAEPGRILCLTYTKAAAAEMRIRLNKRLGEWVVMEDDQLDEALGRLRVAPGGETRARARTLFAEVLDLPGGMRIETIHAFCQSLLRRFPLEARLSPHFELAGEEDAATRLRDARETVLAMPAAFEAVAALAAETDEQSFAGLSAKFCAEAAALLGEIGEPELRAHLRAALGGRDESEAEMLAEAVAPPLEGAIRAALQAIAERGNKSGRVWAVARLDWLALDHAARGAAWKEWAGAFFTAEGEARKFTGFCGKALAAEEEGYKQLLWRETERIAALEDRLKSLRLLRLNEQVLALLAPMMRAERGARELAAQLTYDELISRTSALLVNPGAEWVLYKLDGGLDHLLLDEVQDTAPAQWEIANALAAEFFAGAGAREGRRSIFAVGDAKQSIFSFQGADLRSFTANHARFKALAGQ
ncbi:UvrD-helicase domain-containing protein, partial [Acidocella sp.]|uniref:UvrD-helicase domain-containing protein n=1 Tax=Acidocella sp. TaxID=50710 RepID=UPI0026296EBC